MPGASLHFLLMTHLTRLPIIDVPRAYTLNKGGPVISVMARDADALDLATDALASSR